MTHGVYQINGKDSMAYVGQTPWTGLGQKLTVNMDIATWLHEAGLDWTLLEAPVNFPREINGEFEFAEFEGQKVLYRSDNGYPFSVVSNRYQSVQPREVLEFFQEFVQAGDMTLETAGSLFNGAKIWALARVGVDFTIDGQDKIDPFVLLATSCDRSLATTGQLTSVRVVCNNTLNMAVNGKTASVKVPHSTKFDAQKVKEDMGLVRESIQAHANSMRTMHQTPLTDEQAMKFFIRLLQTPEEREKGEFDADKNRRSMPKLWTSYKSAPGSEDTVWGAVNAVTHSIDYNPHARTDDGRLNNAWFGQGATQKATAYEIAQDTAFLDSIIEKTTVKGDVDSAVDSILDKVAI